jgi:hypothetical protein
MRRRVTGGRGCATMSRKLRPAVALPLPSLLTLSSVRAPLSNLLSVKASRENILYTPAGQL